MMGVIVWVWTPQEKHALLQHYSKKLKADLIYLG